MDGARYHRRHDRRRRRQQRAFAAGLCPLIAVLLAAGACRPHGTPPKETGAPAKPVASTTQVAPPVVSAKPVEDVTNPQRWLTVVKARDVAKGAWATGAFLTKRNRLVIETHGVEAFTINTDRVNVSWDKLVVLRIDGANSELRRRDDAIMRFVRDKHKRWVVVEKD